MSKNTDWSITINNDKKMAVSVIGAPLYIYIYIYHFVIIFLIIVILTKYILHLDGKPTVLQLLP